MINNNLLTNEEFLSGKILIVDDCSKNLEIIAQILHEHGYEPIVAQDGKNGFELAKKSHPDLILLDITMTGLNGYEVCSMLKRDSETSDIPVILISEQQTDQEKVKGFNEGAVDYILKPFNVEELLVRVKTHMSISKLKYKLQDALDEIQKQKEIFHETVKNL